MSFVRDEIWENASYTGEDGHEYETGDRDFVGCYFYIYCGKCGGLDISWLNQAEAEQEKKAIQTDYETKMKRGEKNQSAHSVGCLIAILLGIVLPPVGIALGIILLYSNNVHRLPQKVKTYKYMCEKCGSEFSHTFPEQREDNPFGYLNTSKLTSKVMPTCVYVEEGTKKIYGKGNRKGSAYARKLYLSEIEEWKRVRATQHKGTRS